MEKHFCFGTRNARNVQKLNEWMKDKNRKNPLRLMQTALTSLWCCAGWKFPSKLRIFSLPHHPPVGLHPSQGDKQNLFPAGTASYLWIHQVQSRSDWAAVRRSRWRIHRATIERFISVYRLEENGDLLKEGTGDAFGWALRACSYKTKTEASQQRRSRHTLQGVFLVFVFRSLRLNRSIREIRVQNKMKAALMNPFIRILGEKRGRSPPKKPTILSVFSAIRH